MSVIRGHIIYCMHPKDNSYLLTISGKFVLTVQRSKMTTFRVVVRDLPNNNIRLSFHFENEVAVGPVLTRDALIHTTKKRGGSTVEVLENISGGSRKYQYKCLHDI